MCGKNNSDNSVVRYIIYLYILLIVGPKKWSSDFQINFRYLPTRI